MTYLENVEIGTQTSDIDIIGNKDNELVYVECQSWWGPSKKDGEKQLQQLLKRFKIAPEVIFSKYSFLNCSKLKIKDVFITSGKPRKSHECGPWDRLQDFCTKHKIELVEINAIIRELVQELKDKYPKSEILGKEEGIARFIIHLINNDFLK